MKKIFKFICSLFIINSITTTQLHAGFFDKSIKVQCGTIFYTYEIENNMVYEKGTFKTSNGEIKPLSLEILKDCKIKNSNNWKCGGEYSVEREVGGGSYSWTTETHLVIDGKYSYLPAMKNTTRRESLCVDRKQID